MGQQESKKDIIIEAYGVSLDTALASLDVLLRVKYRAILRKDEKGYYYVLSQSENPCYIQNQQVKSEKDIFYRVFFRIPHTLNKE